MTIAIDEDVRGLAQVLWNYHYLDTGLSNSDFILALGCHDERVAQRAAELMVHNVAPVLVVSGGFGKITRTSWKTTEAERYAQIAREQGVPTSKILLEDSATNTGENLTHTRDLLIREGITVSKGILVTKPYMRRRAYATATQQWSDVQWQVTSPELSYQYYPQGEVSEERMINLMVGDLQRIKVYAERRLQSYQDIPDHVWSSYEELVRRGFCKFLIEGC